MSLINKRYCSHCGTPNPRENKICSKCQKPLNSALKISSEALEEEVIVVKKKRPTVKTKIVYEDDEEFDGEIVKPSFADVLIEKPKKFTIGSLKDGVAIPIISASESLPSDVEVSSKSYFHQEKLD
jgi:predicted RNA-binding protein